MTIAYYVSDDSGVTHGVTTTGTHVVIGEESRNRSGWEGEGELVLPSNLGQHGQVFGIHDANMEYDKVDDVVWSFEGPTEIINGACAGVGPKDHNEKVFLNHVSGRIVKLISNHVNANELYAITDNGYIWKTNNAQDWLTSQHDEKKKNIRTTPTWFNVSHIPNWTSVDIDTRNHLSRNIFVGTNSGFYHSKDYGNTWAHDDVSYLVGLYGNMIIRTMLHTDITYKSTLLMATSKGLFWRHTGNEYGGQDGTSTEWSRLGPEEDILSLHETNEFIMKSNSDGLFINVTITYSNEIMNEGTWIPAIDDSDASGIKQDLVGNVYKIAYDPSNCYVGVIVDGLLKVYILKQINLDSAEFIWDLICIIHLKDDAGEYSMVNDTFDIVVKPNILYLCGATRQNRTLIYKCEPSESCYIGPIQVSSFYFNYGLKWVILNVGNIEVPQEIEIENQIIYLKMIIDQDSIPLHDKWFKIISVSKGSITGNVSITIYIPDWVNNYSEEEVSDIETQLGNANVSLHYLPEKLKLQINNFNFNYGQKHMILHVGNIEVPQEIEIENQVIYLKMIIDQDSIPLHNQWFRIKDVSIGTITGSVSITVDISDWQLIYTEEEVNTFAAQLQDADVSVRYLPAKLTSLTDTYYGEAHTMAMMNSNPPRLMVGCDTGIYFVNDMSINDWYSINGNICCSSIRDIVYSNLTQCWYASCFHTGVIKQFKKDSSVAVRMYVSGNGGCISIVDASKHTIPKILNSNANFKFNPENMQIQDTAVTEWPHNLKLSNESSLLFMMGESLKEAKHVSVDDDNNVTDTKVRDYVNLETTAARKTPFAINRINVRKYAIGVTGGLLGYTFPIDDQPFQNYLETNWKNANEGCKIIYGIIDSEDYILVAYNDTNIGRIFYEDGVKKLDNVFKTFTECISDISATMSGDVIVVSTITKVYILDDSPFVGKDTSASPIFNDVSGNVPFDNIICNCLIGDAYLCVAHAGGIVAMNLIDRIWHDVANSLPTMVNCQYYDEIDDILLAGTDGFGIWSMRNCKQKLRNIM